MKADIGKLKVTLIPLDPSKMNPRRRASINARRIIGTQKYDCNTFTADPSPIKEKAKLLTLVCGHPLRTFHGGAYKQRQAEIEHKFFKTAGLKQIGKGYSKTLSVQFTSRDFPLPYKAILKKHPAQTLEITSSSHYHYFDIITPVLTPGERLTLMIPYKVTHTVQVYGYCLSTGYSEVPYAPEDWPGPTQNFKPLTKDAKRAKAAWRKARIKELEQEVAQREAAIEFMKKWIEKVRQETEGN